MVLTIYVFFPDLFPISHISAISKHTGHDGNTATAGGVTKIHKGNNNNAITETKSRHHSGNTKSVANGVRVNNNNSKVVILTFGDTKKSQFTTAKPILDQYGFKASFFITCAYAGDQKQTGHLSWNDILALQEDGQDIESKAMTHVDLNNLSPSALVFETAGSKQCLENHGINSPNIFAAKYGDVWNNSTVMDTISKYYGFADNGFAPLMFLHCDGYKKSN